MFWTGLARYSTTVPSEPEVPPVIVSPVIIFCCDVLFFLVFLESSFISFGVALDVDPVMVSESGDSLLEDDAINSYVKDLIPISILVTPNILEAEKISNMKILSEDTLIMSG